MNRSERMHDTSTHTGFRASLLRELQIARGHARLLLDGRRGPLSDEQRQSIEVIARQADKLEQLLGLVERDGAGFACSPHHDADEGAMGSAPIEQGPPKPRADAGAAPRDESRTDGLQRPERFERARILVADDDEEILDLLRELLSDRYEVVTSRDGAEALRRLREERFHLAIVDLQLPQVDGFELAEKLRASCDTPPAFMYLSAQSSARVKAIGLNLGAWDYVAKPFDHEELLARVARIVAAVEREQSLLADALTDPLTGLCNYRSLTQNLAREVERSRRYAQPLTLITIDVDDLKRINDEGGHERGNEAIRAVARVLKTAVRSFETVARQGGDEFAILLPNTTRKEALALAERLRVEVSTHILLGRPLSISVGVASCETGQDADLAGLVEQSDQALYRAKRAGRNRVAAAS